MWIQGRNTSHVLGEAIGGGQGILRIRGPREESRGDPLV
jgi:hypothetical protein